MPNFRREIPEYVPPYRRIPRDAPAGTFYCEPCGELHYPGDICWYYESDPEDERELDAQYPEWSGALTTYEPLHNPVFYHENGEER